MDGWPNLSSADGCIWQFAGNSPIFIELACNMGEPIDMPGKPPLRPALAIAVLAVVLAAGTGLAFAGWVNDGAEIFMTLARSGLAWCL